MTHKQRLQRLINNSKQNEDPELRCRNCGETEKVASPSDGDYICVECGVVYEVPIYQELVPFFWGSRGTDRIDDYPVDLGGSSGNYGMSTYRRPFHFHEIVATVFLTGPWIPNADMRLIRSELENQVIDKPGKSHVQLACKEINKRFRVKRFSQKYSEKWIQIIYRCYGDRPGELPPHIIDSIKKGFRLLSNCWDDVSELLSGSKDPKKRIQWPNYFETLYRIIRYKHPEYLADLVRWIPRLSKKKRRDLKPFFKRLFYLVGWEKK